MRTRAGVRLLLAAAVVAGGLAGCSPASEQGPAPSAAAVTASTNPNTPALIAQRQAAGLPDCAVPASRATPVDGGLPAIVLPCLGSEKSVDISQLRGTPMVVTLWAQWCEPCKGEAPLLKEFAKRASEKIGIIGIDYNDPDPAAAITFAEKAGWTYPHLVDPDALLKTRMTLPGIPVTLLVDAGGRVVYRVTGALTSTDQLVALVRDRLGVSV